MPFISETYPGCTQVEVYWEVDNLVDRRPTDDFRTWMQDALAQISHLAPGLQLFGDLVYSGQRVLIRRVGGARPANCCTCHGPQRFVRLRHALSNGQIDQIGEELDYSLDCAAQAGMPLTKVAQRVAQTLSPATVQTALNVVGGPAHVSAAEYMRVYDIIYRLRARDRTAIAEAQAVPGRVLGSSYSISDKLIRILRTWLRPGAGAGSTIFFDPDNEFSCGNDGAPAYRPPLIGLAHELCHAWRNATGTRLFDDFQACGLPDDEVMTTGIPPYQYEALSENLFRSAHPGGLAMRQRYR